jgi:hypothetical protein
MRFTRHAGSVALITVFAFSACSGNGSSVPAVPTPLFTTPNFTVPSFTPPPFPAPAATAPSFPVPVFPAPTFPATVVPGTGVQGPQVRFVNGDFRLSTIDVTFTPGAPNVPSAIRNLPYAQPTDFFAAATFNTLTLRQGGTGAAGTPLAICTLPQLANNTAYSVVIADRIGAPNCMVFLDANYTAPRQYRVHHAADDAAITQFAVTNLAYGVSTSAGAPFVMQGTAPLGAFVTAQNVPTSAVTMGNQVPTGAGATFVVARLVSPAATLEPLATLPLIAVFAPGTFVQPDSQGALPFAPFGGVSLYAIDCTPPAIAAIPGSNFITCGPTGIALIGVFDTR